VQLKLPTPKNRNESIALFRSQIVGALVRRELGRGELRRELRELSRKFYRPPDSSVTRRYAVSTLERWYYDYKNGGLDALRTMPRKDRGHGRALSDTQKQLICDIRREFPNASAALILRTLECDGLVDEGSVSVQTIRRLLRANKLERQSLGAQNHTKVRLRWQAEAPNALWHGDVCHGLNICDGRKPLRVHALLDDRSRYITAIEARHTEREQDMLEIWANALYRHGPPSALYLDNGSTYRGEALRLACERIGTTLIHAKPYDPQARGKMERFWATLRAGCLDYIPQSATLHDVNARLYAFLDAHYHKAPHASLMGRTPAQVWDTRSRDDADSLDIQKIEAALTVHVKRRVRKDSTIRLDGVWWQTDAGFLAGRTVTIAHCLVGQSTQPWLEYEDKRFELEPVEPVANARTPRKSFEQPGATTRTSTSTGFDPPTSLLKRVSGRASERQTINKEQP
jgi:hypothetical protein